MHDLRKQVLLESKKTTSRKAASKAHTPSASKPASPSGSRNGSAAPSRNVSDDESDLNELGDHYFSENFPEVADEISQDALTADLRLRIEQILNTKRSSTEGRETTLNAFAADLARRYSKDEIAYAKGSLVTAFLKSIKNGDSEREVTLALRSISLLIITSPSDTVYDAVIDPIRAVLVDSPNESNKVAAIRAMSVATFYGGASTEETENIMELLLDVVSSDGASIEAVDNADIVSAALEEWAFLATQLDEMEDTEPAMDAFVDQLESSDTRVLVAAAENVALLYEKMFEAAMEAANSDDEDQDNKMAWDAESSDEDGRGPRKAKRPAFYRQEHGLKTQLKALKRVSSKHISRKDLKTIHTTAIDVLNTVNLPSRGPRYSRAWDKEGREQGSRMKINLGTGEDMLIDEWWKLARVKALKRTLGAGFLEHYERNEVVSDSLPDFVAAVSDSDDD